MLFRSRPELMNFVSHTYSAVCHGVALQHIDAAFAYLVEDKLIYRLENSEDAVAATRLGRTVSFAGLSAESGALFGAFLRSLISLSEKELQREQGQQTYLQRLRPMDFYAICLASYEARRDVIDRKSFKPSADALNEYIERLAPEDKPLLHLWRDPASGSYPTRRLLSTLRVQATEENSAYVRLMTAAAALHEFSRSRKGAEEVAETWRLDIDFEGRLSPLIEWLLNGLTRICTSDQCYRLDFLVPVIRSAGLDLVTGGGFGALLALDGVGIRSVETIKRAGYRSLAELRTLSATDLDAINLSSRAKETVKRFLSRRSR